MKKTIFTLCILICLGTLCSCSDDDDNKNTVDITGTYYGNYITVDTKETSLVVTQKEKGIYTLTFSDIAGRKVPPPFDVALEESAASIWQSVAASPYVQFMVNENTVRITSNSGYYYTFTGKK